MTQDILKVKINNDVDLSLKLEDYNTQVQIEDSGNDTFSVTSIEVRQDNKGRKLQYFMTRTSIFHENWQFIKSISDLLQTQKIASVVIGQNGIDIMTILNPQIDLTYEFKNTSFVAILVIQAYEV